jgi:hypothetical protein
VDTSQPANRNSWDRVCYSRVVTDKTRRQLAGGIVDHVHQVQLLAGAFQPIVFAGVPLPNSPRQLRRGRHSCAFSTLCLRDRHSPAAIMICFNASRPIFTPCFLANYSLASVGPNLRYTFSERMRVIFSLVKRRASGSMRYPPGRRKYLRMEWSAVCRNHFRFIRKSAKSVRGGHGAISRVSAVVLGQTSGVVRTATVDLSPRLEPPELDGRHPVSRDASGSFSRAEVRTKMCPHTKTERLDHPSSHRAFVPGTGLLSKPRLRGSRSERR